MIDTQAFLTSPQSFPGAVILTPEAYEEFETFRKIQQGLKEVAEGKGRPASEFFARLDERIEELEAQNNA